MDRPPDLLSRRKNALPIILRISGIISTALINIAKIVENLLSLSNDPDYFLRLFAPDLEHFYWNNPAARQLALSSGKSDMPRGGSDRKSDEWHVEANYIDLNYPIGG